MNNLNKTPEQYREFILKQLVFTSKNWLTAGCKDEVLEKQITYLLNQLHPTVETAMAIFQQYLALEPAA